MEWNWSKNAENLLDPAVGNILRIASRADITSFAGGLPSASSFPVAELSKACQQVLAEEGAACLQYGRPEGYDGLRDWVIRRLQGQGISVTREEVMITSGSQQAIDLISRIMLDPGDVVVTENPAYLAALQVFKSAQARIVPVYLEETGMDLEVLEKVIREDKPKLIYVNPTFQNPTGVTMTMEKRKQLALLSQKYDVAVVEDNPYGEIRFEGAALPAVKSLPDTDKVLYTGTISKIISPGLRVGWLVADRKVIQMAAAVKQINDVLTNSLTQRAVAYYLNQVDLDAHIAGIISEYAKQRDAMLECMQEYFPAGATWTTPEGGMFLWVTLRPGVSAADLLDEAIRDYQVAYVPGNPFFAGPIQENTLRLNFSNSSVENICEGMKRLGQLFTKHS